MFITKIYKYKKDGIIYIGGKVPTDSEVIEIMDILNSEQGKDLIRISDNENIGCNLWLKNGDVQENYKEEEHKEFEPVVEEEDVSAEST